MVGMHVCYNKLLLIVTHQHVGLLQWTAHNMHINVNLSFLMLPNNDLVALISTR